MSTAPGQLLPELLQEFQGLFLEPHGMPPQRKIEHQIRLKPGTEAVAVRPYRYAHLQKDELEKQCAALLAQGIIRPSSSASSSPALLVRKPDNTWRLCIDYRALNACTVKDKFPIPVVEELLDELRGVKYFTKLDLRSGYHQVRMNANDVDKTAFRTHQGLFEFLVMPFGLTNTPATFQALMNDVLQPFLRRFVLVFFDNILIYSQSWADHLLHIRAVFEALQQHALFLKKSKCSFGEPSVGYLGHVISAQGVSMDESKIQAVTTWPIPKSVRAVRGFLGLAGYYRRFIQDYGLIAAPLTRLLKKEGFLWDEAALTAFRDLKTALSKAPVLHLPDFGVPFILECDAYGSGFGAVLHEGSGPIAFFSRPIAPRHAKLAAYERELIGLVQAVKHWRPYLWGREFLVRTDHHSLKFLLDQRLSTTPQHHWATKLLGYDFPVEYKPGAANIVANVLSRREEGQSAELTALSAPSFSFFHDLRQQLTEDAGLTDVRDKATRREDGWSIVDQLLLRDGKVFVPASYAAVSSLLEFAHGMGHEGIYKTLHRLRSDFSIPGDRRLVIDFVRNCEVC